MIEDVTVGERTVREKLIAEREIKKRLGRGGVTPVDVLCVSERDEGHSRTSLLLKELCRVMAGGVGVKD
jgi:hypothetical protein